MEDDYNSNFSDSDTNSSDSDLFSQVDDVKDIELKHFSSISSCEKEHVYFVRKKNFSLLYAVCVCPYGISDGHQGYISVKVSKVLKDRDAIPDVGYDYITWTFSVVDVDGCGRYYQSITKESVVGLPYQIAIPMFLKRSFILERSDELLPGDKLTIRCEAFFVFYSAQALIDDLVFDINPSFENETFAEDSKNGESSETDNGKFDRDFEKNCVAAESDHAKLFEVSEKGLKVNISSESANARFTKEFREVINDSESSDIELYSILPSNGIEENITYYMLIMLCFLQEYDECKQKQNLDSKDFIFQIRLISKILMNTEESDEISKMYKWSDPYFKMYIRLKSKVKEILSKNPIEASEDEDLENVKYNFHPIYTRGSWPLFSESFSVMKKICNATKRLKNSFIESGKKRELSDAEYEYMLKIVSESSEDNPMWEYEYEAMKSDELNLLDSSDEDQDNKDSDCDMETKWTLQIQTKDDVLFNIPFEKGKETFGTKMIACSSVFESMLRNPMAERLSKKVRLPEIDFRTFRSFLQFLQGSGVVTDSFIDLCKIYKMADMYNVKDLMLNCGLMFKPFLTEGTVQMVKFLALMHSDDDLLKIINEESDNLTQNDESNFVVKRSANHSLKEKRYDFDFYQ